MNMSLNIDETFNVEREAIRVFTEEILTDNTDFFNYRLFTPPGTGKSYAIIQYALKTQNKSVVIFPNHDLAAEFKGEVLKHSAHLGIPIEIEHVMGKKQSKFIETEFGDITYNKICNRPEGAEYYPGCWNCSYSQNKSCEWHIQFPRATRAKIVVTTIHNVGRWEDADIIYDEFPETLYMVEHTIHPDLMEFITLGPVVKRKCGKNTYNFFNSVSLQDDIEVDSVEKWSLNAFFQSADQSTICGVYNEGYHLFGKRRIIYPKNHKKLIVLCATTSLDLMYKMLDVKPYRFFTHTSTAFKSHIISNKILRVKPPKTNKKSKGWGRRYSERNLDYYFKLLGPWLKDRRVLVVTKKDFKPRIKKYLPKASIVHYLKGRGTNAFNRVYDLVLVYGRYGFRPLDREKWKMLGFDDALIDQMELSEMLQCIHRARLLKHVGVPVMLMSDSYLFKEMKGIPEVNTSALELFDKYPDNSLALSKRKMSAELGYKSVNMPRVNDYIKIREFLDYVLFESKDDGSDMYGDRDFMG